jgi:ABC-type nickel/cobalt efflux system permease component RcnA
MASLSEVFNAGAADAWVFIPSAILLGALHGLEPGHSKTMMAAFIVAIRGTVAQAVLLGLSATISHTAIVWVVALTGLYFGSRWNTEGAEPYLQIASGLLIVGVAAWMVWRTWRESRPARGHAHDHGHYQHDHARAEHEHPAATCDESELLLLDPSIGADAHEREHAMDINRRFANRHVTTGQIVVFGLTGGLIPCPASITVLLLCLQVGKFGLGAALVLCFSVGLALTMVLAGAGAALGARHVSTRWPSLEALANRAPYFSSAIISLVGLYTIYLGTAALA